MEVNLPVAKPEVVLDYEFRPGEEKREIKVAAEFEGKLSEAKGDVALG